MRSGLSAMALVLTIAPTAAAQPGVLTRELLIEYTPEWKGERYPDGRPKVPDAILDRMAKVTLEEAWAVVTGAGFSHQFDDKWLSIHPEKVLVGRALTSQWLPGRPDILRVIEAKGREQGRVGGTNAWPVDSSSRATSTSPTISASRRTAPRSATTSAVRFTPGVATGSSTTAPCATSTACGRSRISPRSCARTTRRTMSAAPAPAPGSIPR